MRIRMISSLSRFGAGLAGATAALAQALRAGGDPVLIQSDPVGDALYQASNQVREVWERNFRYVRQNRNAAGEAPEYDVLHLQHEYTLYGPPVTALQFPRLLASLRRFHRPVVVTMHHVVPLRDVAAAAKSGYIRGPVPLLRYGLRTITRQIGNRCDSVIVHSNFAKTTLVRDYLLDDGRISVIPLGTTPQPAALGAAEAKSALGLASGRVVLNLGHLARYKGLETLLRAFNSVGAEQTDLQLVIAGGPPTRLGDAGRHYSESLAGLVSPSLRSRVHFPGFVAEALIPTYFAAADLVVLPYASPISSSAALTTAIGYGRPVLASRLGPLEEALPRPEALFTPGSTADLSDHLQSLLDSPATLASLAESNRASAIRNSWVNVASQHHALYETLVGYRAG